MSESIKVVVRVRPLLKFEDDPAWMIKNNTLIELQQSKRNSA